MDDSVAVFLITIASLLMVGAIGELVFVRTRIPDALWLIGVGVFLRISGIVDASTLASITPYFAAMTLIVVLFDGGSRLRVGDLVQAAGRGTVIALATFFVTMVVVALFSLGLAALGLLDPWSWLHGLMLGAIVGGSSSLILMPSLALSRAPARITSLINIESALTDALCAVFTLAFIDVLISGGAGAGGTVVTLLKSFGIACGLGGLLGWAFIPVMRALEGSTYAYPFTLAGLMLLYVLVAYAGGSPAMGVLAFAVIVGNAAPFTRWLHRLGDDQDGIRLDARVTEVHAQISFIVKSLFFTFLGLMLSPPWGLLIMGAVMGLVLLLARLPAVFLAIRGADLSEREVDIAYVCLPRGMAAGALATMPHLAGVPGTEGVPTLVFAAVITSIVIFTVGFRRAYAPEGKSVVISGPKGQVPKDRAQEPATPAPAPTLADPTAGVGAPAAPNAEAPHAEVLPAEVLPAGAPPAEAPPAEAPPAEAPIAGRERLAGAPPAEAPPAEAPLAGRGPHPAEAAPHLAALEPAPAPELLSAAPPAPAPIEVPAAPLREPSAHDPEPAPAPPEAPAPVPVFVAPKLPPPPSSSLFPDEPSTPPTPGVGDDERR